MGDPVRVGLRYRYFEGAWDSLPDFNALKPAKEGIIPDFVFTPRNQDDLFCFVYDGYVTVPESSVCFFFTNSDDGSRLWIDDQLIVNNDGLHGLTEKSGCIALAKGSHKIRVAFFERTGSDTLEVSVMSQTMPKQKLSKDWLYY